jgi:S-adenosylmethionine hydrolase
MTRPIVFLSDFGFRNEFVGLCHAVIARIAPASRVIDLSHGVPPMDVQMGALLLADSLPYVPDDAVLLAVVDPGVGTARKDVAVKAGSGRFLVGPDNGLLSLAFAALGGPERAGEIAADDVVLRPVSPTLHARDVLCPAAAWLAAGKPLEELGPPVDPATLVRLGLPEAEVQPGKIQCEVLDLDRFGNVQLNLREGDLEAAGFDGSAELEFDSTAAAVRARRVATYSDVAAGEYAVILDHRHRVALVRNRANAAEGLGVSTGDPVWITRAS